MEYIYVRHSSSCSSSWWRLYGEFAIFQESSQEIIETVVSSDSEADHWPDWNYWYYNDWLTAAHVERDDSADWQSCSVCNCKNLRLLFLSATSGRLSILNQSKHGKVGFNGSWKQFFFFTKKMDRIDGEPLDFEWKNVPGFTTLGILDEIQKTMTTELKCELEHFNGRIIFMSMYNDIDWGKRGNKENCIANAHRVTEYARRFTREHWSFLGLGSEKKWYGTHVSKSDGQWDKTAEDMMLNFAESGHPVFCATSALEKRKIEKQRERNEIHSLQR